MILQALGFVARHGRWCLVAGLVAGFTLPDLAALLRHALPPMIALLLLLSAFRVGPRAALGGLADARQSVWILCLYQIAAPVFALAVFATFGLLDNPFALASLLVLAAPSITGGASFTVLLGRDPAIALRLLLAGTALFPLTALLVLWTVPGVASVLDALVAASRLVAVIFGAVAVAFALRHWCAPKLTAEQTTAVDGLSAILLGVIVVGLMSAVGPALRTDPALLAQWLVFACALNFGAQALAAWALPLQNPARDRTGAAIVAGNRNIALFLVALPEAGLDMVLMFIGCYQVPMYLTPIVMRRIVAP